ncbi:MAG: hypothetical protein K2Q26_09620 [Bdellovibrionales bacterium]|nr:hypothetical protein [Bdellovibrionales bacterium]
MKYCTLLILALCTINCSSLSRGPASVSVSREVTGRPAEGLFAKMKQNPNSEVVNRFRHITGESQIFTVERVALGQDACEKRELGGSITYKCVQNAQYDQEILDREGYQPPPPDEPYKVQKEEYRSEYVELRY